jgi:putative glycosyltransferase (TIGR04348 family)
MRIFLSCSAPPGSRSGNRVTAMRWARILESLRHRVTIDQEYEGQPCDLLVALHARRSYPSIVQFRRTNPHRPLIVALTGTDLYRDIHTSRHAQQSLEWADRLIVLQPRGRDELPARHRSKVRVIYQSTSPTWQYPAKKKDSFDVCVLGHLRHEKDPFRTALALRKMPRELNICVLHAGRALSAPMARRALSLMERDRRYIWVGEQPRALARRMLVRSRLLVLSSRMEGGANVISEAVVEGVPVLASRIAGNVGLLGARYPGFFPVGDTAALARLLLRAISDSSFYEHLRRWCADRKPLFDPARERNDWSNLLAELAVAGQRK